MIDGLLDQHFAAVLSRRRAILGLEAVSMLSLATGTRFSGIANNCRGLLEENDPQLVECAGLGASVMAAMGFGIIIDDTIHFLSRYMKARREGQVAPDAVRTTFRTVGQALWTTTAVLCAGFLVFASSGVEAIWSLGLLVTFMIGFALLADFLLLPPLSMYIDRARK